MTAELQQGQRLANRFTLVRRLGSGGMSEVWLAQDDGLGEQVALKLLDPRLAASPGMVDLLEREHRNASRLVHPAIVRSYDWHSVDGLHFISMEAVPGGDFSRYVQTPPSRFVPQLLPVVDALEYAHDQGVVHRDLKLSNILCDRAGHAQLADFGISAALSPAAGDAVPVGGGSPYSRSPQQVQGEPPSPADDLYALGVLLYELIDGHPPFYPDISDEAVMSETPRPPEGDAPESLKQLVMALLAKSPEGRPANMGEVQAKLRGVLSADTNATVPPDVAVAGGSLGASRFEQIEPETFRGYSAPAAAAGEAPERTVDRNTVMLGAWVALGALMLIAGAVFFYLPKTVDTSAPTAAQAPESSGASQAAEGTTDSGSARPPPTGLTPWDTAQLARDREAAEAVLEDLLALQFELEEKDVRVWADGQFDEARAMAREGDQAYSARDYAAAARSFTESLELLRDLEARSETVLETTLAEGWAAYDEGDAQRATERFELAIKIDETSEDARSGLARTAKLPDVLASMEAGADSERGGDVAAALASYQAAAAIDGEYEPATAAVARMQERLGNQNFNEAMSRGFVALEQQQFRTARTAFSEALQMMPGSAAARDALAQANLEIRLGELSSLQSAGVAAADAEDWDTALEKFQAVLKLDSSVVFAREGAQRARDRGVLDKQLQRFIDDPQRLSQDAVFSSAQQALGRAETVPDKGPKLSQQMQQLARLLAVARIPVPVKLVSDNVTEVTLLRVDRLGRFESRDLKLRPGKYTAVGIRDGFRDVREEFTLEPGASGQTVRVQCEERI